MTAQNQALVDLDKAQVNLVICNIAHHRHDSPCHERR